MHFSHREVMMKIRYFIGLVVILAIFAISSVETCFSKSKKQESTTTKPKPTEPTPVDCGIAKEFGSCQDPCRWSHVIEKCITKEEFDKCGWNGLVNSGNPTVPEETGVNVPTEMNNTNEASYPTGASVSSVVTEETGTTEPSIPIETNATIFANIPSDKPTTTSIPNTSSGPAVTTVPTVTSRPNSETPTTKLESVEPNRFPETETTVNAIEANTPTIETKPTPVISTTGLEASSASVAPIRLPETTTTVIASVPTVVTEGPGINLPTASSIPTKTKATMFASTPSDIPETTFIPNTSSRPIEATTPTIEIKPTTVISTTRLEASSIYFAPTRLPETTTTVIASVPITVTKATGTNFPTESSIPMK